MRSPDAERPRSLWRSGRRLGGAERRQTEMMCKRTARNTPEVAGTERTVGRSDSDTGASGRYERGNGCLSTRGGGV